jgi:hypothetical protein
LFVRRAGFFIALATSGTKCQQITRKMSENTAVMTGTLVDGQIFVATTKTSAASPSASGTVDSVTSQLPTL